MRAIKFLKLYPDAVAPTRAYDLDAGWDLTAHSVKLLDSGACMFCTGIAIEIPPGLFGLIRPRSSMAHTCYVVGASGVIDSGYRGELMFTLKQLGRGKNYNVGDRFAQLVILPLPEVEFTEATALSPSHRGVGGFGSSDKQPPTHH